MKKYRLFCSLLTLCIVTACNHLKDMEKAEGSDPCGANKLSQFIGRQDSAQLREEISGVVGSMPAIDRAKKVFPFVRYIEDGDTILADYRANRINVSFSEGDILDELSCG